MVAAGPALTVTEGFTVNITWLLVFPQGVLPLAVKVKVILPVSPGPGV
jgi:hypothetical protein